jgi:CubicO group peptidase (beta-lactamase class C family)
MTSNRFRPPTSSRARLRVFAVALATLALLTTIAPTEEADSPAAIAGSWKGAIEVPGSLLEIEIELTAPSVAADPDAEEGDAAWSGTISIPVQRIEDFPLVDFAATEPDTDVGTRPGLRFSIGGIPGAPTFDGTLSEDGQTLSGPFTQGGGNFTFTLKRADVAAAELAQRFADLDEVIPAALETFGVPGVAIGVVKNGEVVFARGYGWRDAERQLPITTGTQFSIGSSSKAFTTYLLATFADEGKFSWDEPIRTYVPEFAMEDDYATLHATTRDAVAHRTGLPRHDLVWYNSDTVDYHNVVERLPHLKMNAEFRERWQYNNLMYMTAGHVAEVLGGDSWEALVRARIFGPLGMTRTHTSIMDAKDDPNGELAIGYRPVPDDDEEDESAEKGTEDSSDEGAAGGDDADDDEGEENDDEEGPRYEVTPYRDDRNVAPAGGITSSVDDMLKWVEFQAGDGEFRGTRLMTKGLFAELHAPVSVIPGGGGDYSSSASYALGWGVDAWRGHDRVQHGGAIDGFLSEVWFFPKDGVGLVVFTNMSGTPLTGLVANTVADRALGLEPIDWIGLAAKKRDQAKEMEDDISGDLEAETRVAGTSPSHPLGDYAGDFTHPGYGTISITFGEDREYPLEAEYNRIRVGLKHWHYDVFQGVAVGEDKAFEDAALKFGTSFDGKIATLSLSLEPSVDPIVFERAGDQSLTDPEVLAGLAGKYAIGPQPMEFVVVGNELVVDIIGQPRYNLDPANDWTFKLRGLDGFSIRFAVDEDGRATSARFIQPNGVFIATRTDDKADATDDGGDGGDAEKATATDDEE